MSGKSGTLLYLFLLWLIYLTVGVFIFRAVEHDGEEKRKKTKQQLLEAIKDNIATKYNMSESEFNTIVHQIEAASSSSAGPEWSYPEAVSFVIQLVTTIGYGNITPVTTGGRVLCIIFAFFGIPINIVFLQSVGQSMLRGEQLLITKFETSCLKRQGELKFLNEKCTLCGIVLLVLLLVISAGVQINIDDWTFFEGFYAYFITFTTVGFGDLIPGGGETKSPGNTAIRVIFIILGLAAMANVINGVLNSTECLDFLKSCKVCFGRGGSVDIPEANERGGMELTEYHKDDPETSISRSDGNHSRRLRTI